MLVVPPTTFDISIRELHVPDPQRAANADVIFTDVSDKLLGQTANVTVESVGSARITLDNREDADFVRRVEAIAPQRIKLRPGSLHICSLTFILRKEEDLWYLLLSNFVAHPEVHKELDTTPQSGSVGAAARHQELVATSQIDWKTAKITRDLRLADANFVQPQLASTSM